MQRRAIVAVLLGAASLLIYFAKQETNPPAFYTDEASVAWNALTIARTGVDEYGTPFPLYFRAFGEYKNPTYIYLLAAVFKVLPPSELVARRVSATLGWAACVVLGLLSWRISRSLFVACFVFITAVLTPMIYEISRLVFEVALYPLAIALFVYVSRMASERARWSVPLVAALVITLALVAFTYSVGRLLAPLLAGMLLFLYTRERRLQIAIVIMSFVVVAIVPMLVYNARHGGALSNRFQTVTYVNPSEPLATLVEFERRYVMNLLPLALSLRGDPQPRHHVQGGGGSILLITSFLAVAGAARTWRAPWWRLVIAGTLASMIPAALTTDMHHTLRLAPLAPFLLTLSIPAVEWLRPKRWIVAALAIVVTLQVAFFIVAFSRADRRIDFEYGVREIVATALAQKSRPIIIHPTVREVLVYWHANQLGATPAEFAATSVTASGSVVLHQGALPPDVRVLHREGFFAAYIAP